MGEPIAPPDDFDAGLEGNLGQLTNEAWLSSHRALIDSGAIPADELGYLYDPDRDPETVSVSELNIGRDPKEPDHA